jgi:propanol-preferring alcohol dehydrogenase
MLLTQLASLDQNPEPLALVDLDEPEAGPGQVRIRVGVCGVCHTELDEIEGRLPPASLPVVPGHQVVGVVDDVGPGVDGGPRLGDRVGVAWIFSACGSCPSCLSGQENLCDAFRGTGKDANGGYAQFMTAPAGFVHPIPATLSDAEAAPLLCAGAIGYRSLRLTGLGDGSRLGLTGFGGSGHLVLKLVQHVMPGTDVFVFARSPEERRFAMELGAAWAGDTGDRPPAPLDAIIDTTPAWTPVVRAMDVLAPGGRLVINAIRKEAGDQSVLMDLDYPRHLWMEKEIKSVANVTRQDVREFLGIAGEAGLRPRTEELPLEEANHALVALKHRAVRGAKVLRIG